MSETNPWHFRPSKGGDYHSSLEAGNYPAVLVALVDLGIQESDYQGTISYRQEIYLAWEIPGESGSPVLGKSFAAILTPKSNLGKWMSSLSSTGQLPPEGVDLTKLLGTACLLQVAATVKEDRTFNSLANVSRLVKGMSKPASTRQPVMIGLRDEIPEWLPRLYGRLLADVRAESVEESGRTRSRYEDWRRSRRQAPAVPTPPRQHADEDDSPF